jgi:serpin B
MAEVNEEGTEAAATTAVLMGRSLLGPPRMVVNRPFFWAVRDDRSGALLFAGAVFDPS